MDEIGVWIIFALGAAVAFAVARINPILGWSRRRLVSLALLAGLFGLIVLVVAWEGTSRDIPATASGVHDDGG
jgi:hypothetical protein